MKKQFDITKAELKINLAKQGIKVKPSYHHEDYMFTSFTMPYPTKNKLDFLCKKIGISRSSLVAHLIESFYKEANEAGEF